MNNKNNKETTMLVTKKKETLNIITDAHFYVLLCNIEKGKDHTKTYQ